MEKISLGRSIMTNLVITTSKPKIYHKLESIVKRRIMQCQCICTFVAMILLVPEPYLSGISTASAAALTLPPFAGCSALALDVDARTLHRSLGLSNSEIESLLDSAATGSGIGVTIMEEYEDITDREDEYEEEYRDYEKEEEDFIEGIAAI